MSNEARLSQNDLAEIESRIQSEADEDRAMLAADAAALLADVRALHLALAARDAHLETLGRALGEVAR